MGVSKLLFKKNKKQDGSKNENKSQKKKMAALCYGLQMIEEYTKKDKDIFLASPIIDSNKFL